MEKSKHNKTCKKCEHNFVYFPEDTWWDYQGYTPTKLIKCPECGCIQALLYEEQNNPNYDRRFYD